MNRTPYILHANLHQALFPINRSRTLASVAKSIAVHAIAIAPSLTALSAASVTQCVVNSGWWFTAGSELILIAGWMDGNASETLPISVDPAARSNEGAGVREIRPSASTLRRYAAAI